MSGESFLYQTPQRKRPQIYTKAAKMLFSHVCFHPRASQCRHDDDVCVEKAGTAVTHRTHWLDYIKVAGE